jgi:hypothetical protein
LSLAFVMRRVGQAFALAKARVEESIIFLQDKDGKGVARFFPVYFIPAHGIHFFRPIEQR